MKSLAPVNDSFMWFLSLTPFLKSIEESALPNVLTHTSHVFRSDVRARTCVTAPSGVPARCCGILQHSTSLYGPRCPPDTWPCAASLCWGTSCRHRGTPEAVRTNTRHHAASSPVSLGSRVLLGWKLAAPCLPCWVCSGGCSEGRLGCL